MSNEHPEAPELVANRSVSAAHPGDDANSVSAELAQLRIRVIALENLMITLLAQSSHSERRLAHAMAKYISPRPGFTNHRTTLHAATQMVHLIRRASHFQGLSPTQLRRQRGVLPK
jgi:hypothetical protein